MSNPVTVSIEGPDAFAALAELLAIPGIEGEVRRERREVFRSGEMLLAVGTIVGIVGGIASLVSSILDWRERWKKAHENQRLSVTIEDAKGNRLALNDASPEQITAALQSLVA